MYGPDYTLGACPGCSSLGDGLDGSLVHLEHQDVTLICFSRAPIDDLVAYKRRMGWQFPYVSTYDNDFASTSSFAFTAERARERPEIQRAGREPSRVPRRVVAAGRRGARRTGCARTPTWIAFAREGDAVYLTYRVSAPDPFVRPYFSFLLERTAEDGRVSAPSEGRVSG